MTSTVTIRDVAKLSGTSVSTVSRVLNGVPTVDQSLAAKVKNAALQLGYKPNQAGRNLRIGMDSAYGPEFEMRSLQNLEAKRVIALAAAELIQPSDIIVLDSGSTVAQMVPFLPQGVLVFTNSLAILQPAAKRGIHVHLAPGLYVPEMSAVFGKETEEYFSLHRPTKYFLSSARVDVHTGLYNVHPATSSVKKAVLENSSMSVLLVHHDKFCDAGLESYAPLSMINTIVTDFVPHPFNEVIAGTHLSCIEVESQRMNPKSNEV